MKSPPPTIDGASVLAWTVIDERHRPTGRTRHKVGGEPVGPAAALAICKYDGDGGLYLFGCNSAWETVTDTLHGTLDEAKAQAEREYAGSLETWQHATDRR